MTPEEFVAKADWEGGMTDAILGYGLSEDDLDDSDPQLKAAVKAFREAVEPLLHRLHVLADKYAGAGEDLD